MFPHIWLHPHFWNLCCSSPLFKHSILTRSTFLLCPNKVNPFIHSFACACFLHGLRCQINLGLKLAPPVMAFGMLEDSLFSAECSDDYFPVIGHFANWCICLKLPVFFLQSTIQGSAQGLLPLPFWVSTVPYLIVMMISSYNISGVVLQESSEIQYQTTKQKGSDKNHCSCL